MDIIPIQISLIDEDKDQPRYQFNQEALDELANSIRELGLLSPIKVLALDNGRYKIIYGNRRYKASLMVGLATIPCIVSTNDDELDIYYEQIAENLTREDFSPIEEAEAYHKLMNDDRFRSSIMLLSSKLGKTEKYIRNKLELLVFGTAVKKKIVSGTQIRKDCLTEEQLIPLKDLTIEYRDPLALIIARDELAVSDVKKIAKLFKDTAISSATKDKLLFKDGAGLIDTWSTYEQNRKEKLAREKQLKEQQEIKQRSTEQAAMTPTISASYNEPSATTSTITATLVEAPKIETFTILTPIEEQLELIEQMLSEAVEHEEHRLSLTQLAEQVTPKLQLLLSKWNQALFEEL